MVPAAGSIRLSISVYLQAQLIISAKYKARDELTSWESPNAETNSRDLSLPPFWQELGRNTPTSLTVAVFYAMVHFRARIFIEHVPPHLQSSSAAVRQLSAAHNRILTGHEYKI